MRSFAWINKVWVLAFTVGLTRASCTTKQNTVLSKDGVPPPPAKLTDRY